MTVRENMRPKQNKSIITPKVAAINELLFLLVSSDNSDTAVLDEVHFTAHCTLTNNDITWQEDLTPQLSQEHSDKVWITIPKQWHVCYQFTAIVAHYILL